MGKLMRNIEIWDRSGYKVADAYNRQQCVKFLSELGPGHSVSWQEGREYRSISQDVFLREYGYMETPFGPLMSHNRIEENKIVANEIRSNVAMKAIRIRNSDGRTLGKMQNRGHAIAVLKKTGTAAKSVWWINEEEEFRGMLARAFIATFDVRRLQRLVRDGERKMARKAAIKAKYKTPQPNKESFGHWLRREIIEALGGKI